MEDVPGADRLVRLIVDLGDHKRRIRAGIKQEREDPTEIEGKQALFVVDLEPREMMGEISGAILFDIRYADGIAPALAVPERPGPRGQGLTAHEPADRFPITPGSQAVLNTMACCH